MRYYAADNLYGSDTSIGFTNTWRVMVFSSKAARDDFVENGNRSTRSIKRREIGQYIPAPKPFTGEARVLNTWMDEYQSKVIPGFVGQVIIGFIGEHSGIERL